MMRRVLICTVLAALVMAVCSQTAFAQESSHYVFFAPGNEIGKPTKSETYEGGAGLERALERYLAVQLDVAALSHFDSADSRTVSGLGSFDAALHTANQRVQVFVVGGYSVRFGHDTSNMFNYGGGVRHWFREKRGLLVEFRDHRAAASDDAPHHFWSVRLGVVYR